MSKGYPGEGQNMSIYGLNERSPGECVGQWKEYIKTEDTIHNRHLAIKGNGSKLWPGVEKLSPEQLGKHESFFNTAQRRDEVNDSYKRMFHVEPGYNSKLHRDDRQHTVGLDIHKEEGERTVPVKASSEYGRRVESGPLEPASRKHVRIDRVVKGFYRARGTGIPERINDTGMPSCLDTSNL